MTKEELKQIYYINKEIKMWQAELDRIQCKSLIKGQEITDMPRGGGTSDTVANIATEIADIRTIINGKLVEIQVQRKRVIEYIDGIEDSLTRQILFYRHVSCMEWGQVARNIGGDNTADCVRMIHNRFLK